MSGLKEDINKRDAIDFASEDIGKLFRKMFVPTLLGMVSMVLFNLADGAFVGHGAGTCALAAINIAAPIFDLLIGLGIMFGIGASVVSSIHLSKGNVKAARINCTQALTGSFILTSTVSVLILTHLDGTCRLFGSSDALIPLAGSYLRWVALALPFCILGNVGSFIIRLDGSPGYSMCCTLLASLLNIFLDWLFIFPLDMGLEGAAIATSISFTLSTLAVFIYIIFFSKTLRPYRLKLSLKSLALTLRNLWYQAEAGFSAMLGELALSFTVIVGNHVFIRHLGEDGVAAYGVICYCMPVIFMLANAIIESIQPILSFAYGMKDRKRIEKAGVIALRAGIIAGLLSSTALVFTRHWVTAIFITPGETAFDICVGGLPYFGAAGLFISVNMVLTGYLQSIEKAATATLYSFLRGFLFLTAAFAILPGIVGDKGIWLAIPAAEAVTLLIMAPVIRRVSFPRDNDPSRTRR